MKSRGNNLRQLVALFFFICMGGMAHAQDKGCEYCFLKTSPVLKAHNLHLVPVTINTRAEVAASPYGAFLWPWEDADEHSVYGPDDVSTGNSPAFLMSAKGLVPLKESRNGYRMDWGQGPMPTRKYDFPDPKKWSNGKFVILGEKAPEIVKWYPSEEIVSCPKPLRADCAGDQNLYQTNEFKCWSSGSLPFHIYVQSQSGPFNADRYMAGNNEKWCRFYNFVNRTGLLEKTGECKLLNKEVLDCDYSTRDASSFSMREFLGVLDLDNGTEKWLVFDAESYEAAGFTAVLYDPGKPASQWKREQSYFWGS